MAPRELLNTEKAAVCLLSLGKEIASQVLQHVTEQEIKRISRAFMAVSEVDRETQFEVNKKYEYYLSHQEEFTNKEIKYDWLKKIIIIEQKT